MTAETTMVPDFYARLGVDPGAQMSEIEAALKRLQPAWSMGTRNPKTRHANQLYLDEIPSLRKASLERSSVSRGLRCRAGGRPDCRARPQARRAPKAGSPAQAKGGLSASDRKLLADEAAKLGLSEDDVLRVTRPIPDLIESIHSNGEAELDQDPPADVLDPSTQRQIRVAIEHLGCRDLYDALGVSRDAPPSYIAIRADEERQRWMKKAQVTAEKTAWLEVIAHAQSHLGSPKPRGRYDRTLALETEDSFQALATFALNGLRHLDASTESALIEEAAALGISSERADRLIGRLCRKSGVRREHRAVTPLAASSFSAQPSAIAANANGAAKYSLLRCRHCAGVTELSPVARKASTARCRHCGSSLKWDCPICKRVAWVDERRCACGFRQALREPVVRHFEAAQNAFRNFDLEKALEHLERVQALAPNLAGARNGMTKVRQRQVDIARIQRAYETAQAGGSPGVRAGGGRSLEPAGRSRIAGPSGCHVGSSSGLARAESLAARARNAERTDPATARDLYRQSLAIAADLADALAGLKRTPPDPPTALDGQVLGDRIRLSWSPPPPDGLGPLTFVVVRKRGGSLNHPGDGTRIAEVSTNEFDDMHAAPGETVGYAILSKRGGIESVTAISLGPFVFLADVKDVHVELRDQEVELAWTLPRGVSEVRVIRKSGGPPTGPRDGDRIPAAHDHTVDRNLNNNEIFHYGIYAIYAMADGKLFPSPGVILSARSHPPVSPLEAPRLLMEPGGRVRIDWLEPARGTVKIVRTARPLLLAAGSRLSQTEAATIEGIWIEPSGPDRAYDLEPPAEGYCYYTPLTAWGSTLTIGHMAALSRVPDPSELRATRSGSGLGAVAGGTRVTLRWSWAAESSAAIVVARLGTPPLGPSDPAAVTETVHRADYDRQACWSVSLPPAHAGPQLDTALPSTHSSTVPAAEPRRRTLDHGTLEFIASAIEMESIQSHLDWSRRRRPFSQVQILKLRCRMF